jgi:hypothetical protein
MTTNITADEFASKYQAKLETYRFVACDMDAFVPEERYVTCIHLKEIVAGSKR